MVALEKAFGMTLSRERTRAGLSQEELAFRAGLHTNAVSLLELGKRKPGLHTVFSLSHALGKKPSELIKLVEDLNPKAESRPPDA